MAKIKTTDKKKAHIKYLLDEAIPSLETKWQPEEDTAYPGERVEEFLKAQLKSLNTSVLSKMGYPRWVKDGDFYYLEGFNTEADAMKYDADPTANASLRLFHIQLPISTVQGDSYSAYLYTSLSNTTDFVVSSDKFNVPLRFSAVRLSNGDRLNNNSVGTLIIERSTDGGATWKVAETRVGVLNSADYPATGYTNVDIGSALATGSQKIRLRATFNYEGEDGGQRTATSTYVAVGNSINKTSISIVLSTDQQPYTPIWVNQLGASGARKFPLAYVCNGNVAKALHYSIYDGTGTLVINGTQAGITSNGSTIKLNVGNEKDNPNLFTHGVKTVLAYLTADDGLGGLIYSNAIVSRFMVVNEQDAAAKKIEDKRYFLLQQAIPADKMDGLSDAQRLQYFDTFTNYTEGNLFDYALFVPSKDASGNIILDTNTKVPITFYLSDYLGIDKGEWAPDKSGVTLYVEQQENEQASSSELKHFTPSIEIDSASTSLYAYLHVWLGDEGSASDFMYSSFGVKSFSIPIDNSESYAPLSGATFQLNPRTRNNTESNPARILNAADNNAVVDSVFTGFDFQTDGWITDGSQKLLRIPSGRKVNIKMNPYEQFRINPKSSMMMEMDFVVNNVTNEDDPIFQIGETVSGVFRGLRIFPLKGEMWVKSYGNHTDDIDFGWREGQKVHLSIAWCANVNPVKYGIKYGTPDVHVPDSASDYYKDPSTTTIGIVKIFIGGNKQREIHFNTDDRDEFCTAPTASNPMPNGGIFIGMDGADIDIYSMRMYANKEFTDDDVLTNYISSLPTTAQKKQLASDNDIMSDEVGKNGKVVSIDKVQAKGKNTILWHGRETSFLQDANLNGWIEIKKYDSNGNFLPKFSGSLCRTTGIEVLTGNKSEWNKSLKDKDFPFVKGQGSSAKTYWDWNQQFDQSKFKATIRIPRSKFDSSIVISETKTLDDGSTVVDIYGGDLGADFPLGNTPKQYPIDEATGLIEVPDGWIDGNGILIGETGTVWHTNGDEETVEGTGYYRGPCYQVAENTPLFQKGVWKINYASCQQSHLVGVNNIYNDIHTAIVGQNDLQKAAAKNGQNVRVSKYTEPFFYFIKNDEGSDILYRGGCTFGAGKMDKATWGYAKKFKGIKDIKKFCMFEGSDNSLTATDFRVPFTWKPQGACPDEVTYDVDGEGFGVNEAGADGTKKFSQCWDFDGGATYEESDELADPTHKTDYPKDEIIQEFADFANFVYLHNPAIKAYTDGDGTFESFLMSAKCRDYYSKYWMTQGNDKYRLYRYSFGSNTWVDAGLWTQLSDGSYGWEPVYVNSSEPFKYAASKYATTLAAEPDRFNMELIKGALDDFKARLPLYMDPKSLQVYYCLEIHFFCGTDNCGKNTYIVLSQFDRDVTITLPDGTTETHTGVCRFEMHSDDVDTTMAIDNNGRVTHEYDVDRMHPYNRDNTATAPTYSGMNNVLFNICEQAWDSDTDNTLRTVMAQIFSVMITLASVNDNIPGYPYDKSTQPSVLGVLYKYIFFVESYFPARAYNEQGRIRYEYPETLGFITARQVKPIWQSQGSMDQYELEFMMRRIVYMVTYAAWGPASSGSGITGIPDADEGEFSMTGSRNPDGTNRVKVAVTLTAHQTIYPTGNVSGAAGVTIDPHHRVRAGEAYTLSLGENTFENDTYFCVYMRNFYRSFGNLADISMKTEFILNGIRLTEFILNPDSVEHFTDTTDGSITKGESIAPFRPETFRIGSARNLKHLDIHGLKSVSGDLNLQSLTRLVDFNDEGTRIATVELPETRSLETLKYSDTITDISLPNHGGMKTLEADGYSALKSLEFGHNTPDKAVVPFIRDCAANATQEVAVSLDNVAWNESFVMSVLMWMIRQTDFKGTGYVTVSSQLTANAVKNVSDILGEECFYEDALKDGKLYVKTQGGNFLVGPDTIVSGSSADYRMVLIPHSDYVPDFRLADYDRSVVNSDGETVYYKGTVAINSRTGHLTSEESISDIKVTVQGYYADNMHLDQSLSITKTTYPQEIRAINGASAIKDTGDYEYSSVVYPANYTGHADYLWELASGNTAGLTLVQNGNSCTLKVSDNVPVNFNKVTLRLTVTCGNGSTYSKTKDIFYSKEQPIVTSDTNAALMQVAYAKGWAANETYMLASEAAAVTDLGDAFTGNTELQHFEQLQYFSGLTAIPDNAFKGCTALEDVTLPSQVTTIGAHAYDGCTALTVVSLPYVQTIGDYAFHGCTNVRELVFGDRLESFGTEAFSSMQITELSFGPNVSKISLDAFDDCQKLTTVTVSNNRFLTWGMAFKNCRSLSEYRLSSVEGAFAYLKVDGGIIYRTDTDMIVAVPQACTTFTTTGYAIADYAFYWNQKTIGYTVFNNANGSCQLTQGNTDSLKSALQDYVAAMKFYVFDAKGTQMAEIKSATFAGDYANGMIAGTVTFADGTVANIADLNAKGCNFMAYRPKMYFKSFTDDNGREILQQGGGVPIDGGHSFNEKFIGMFKAYNQSGVLKSQPGRIPTGSETIAIFQAQAEAGGRGYGLWNYHDWCKENALHISWFGNTNYEINVGTGRINNYNNVRNIVTGFTLPMLIDDNHGIGTAATVDSAGNAVNALDFFGVEGLGEQIWEFVIGCRCDATKQYIWDDNSWSETHQPDYTLDRVIADANGSYIREIIGGEHFAMMPRKIGGTSTTGWADGTWANSNNGRFLCVGGDAGSGSICGLSASYSYLGFGYSDVIIGARLAFYARPVEVSGAKFVQLVGIEVA